MTQTCLVNLFHLDPPRNGGTARVAKEICRMLAGYAQTRQVRVVFAVGWRFAQQFPAWLREGAVEVIPCWPEVGLTPLFRALQPDLLVSPLYGMEPYSQANDLRGVPYVVSVPDVLLLSNPESLSAAEAQRRQELYRQLPDAFRVVVQSEHSRQHFMRHLGLTPEQVKVVYLAGDYFGERDGSNLLPSVPQPYVFYPANGWPHKRHALLLQIMKEVWRKRPDMNLALTGWRELGFINDLARRYGCPESRIFDLGYVSDAELAALYGHAEAMLFVSEYEGFGMPLLEAMANSCPVICAPLTSIPEVAGDAALYVNSTDPKDWAEALLSQLPGQRVSLIEQGRVQAGLFSWERFRREWRGVLREAGLRPLPPTQDSQSEIMMSLEYITQELAIWSSRYAALHTEFSAKETEIQNLAATAQVRANELAAKEGVIQEQQAELEAKEGVIHSLVVYARSSPHYWAIRLLREFGSPSFYNSLRRLYRRFFVDKLHQQHAPIPLKIPPHYYETSIPARPALPVVSIVTPSFNHASFLERTITSVLNQNYPNLEYIIQDGGSIDGTAEILAKYRPRLKRVESKPDKGQANAINQGFAQASGEIMAWLNSDDLLLPGAVSYVVNYFLEHPEVDVVYGHRITIDQNDGEVGRWLMPAHNKKILLWADYIPQETLFWRRRLWEQVGGYVNESFKFALDWELLLRFQAAGARFARLPRFLGAFRIHPAQKNIAWYELGQQEMARLRAQCHGRAVSWLEIKRQVQPYLLRSGWLYLLYRLGLLRH